LADATISAAAAAETWRLQATQLIITTGAVIVVSTTALLSSPLDRTFQF